MKTVSVRCIYVGRMVYTRDGVAKREDDILTGYNLYPALLTLNKIYKNSSKIVGRNGDTYGYRILTNKGIHQSFTNERFKEISDIKRIEII